MKSFLYIINFFRNKLITVVSNISCEWNWIVVTGGLNIKAPPKNLLVVKTFYASFQFFLSHETFPLEVFKLQGSFNDGFEQKKRTIPSRNFRNFST